MAVAEYAEAARDTEVLRRVDACFRWAREMGDPLVGWFPEFQPGTYEFEEQDFESVEICEVSDMVFLALLLTRNGAGDYWDDVDRWVRNMYAEGQMTDADFVKHTPDRYLNPAPGEFSSQRWISIWNAASKDARDIASRSVGSFYGWMRANDGLLILKGDNGEEKLSPRSIMHCCTANGARTLYYVWDSIVSTAGEEVRVNLLLNRASEWLDVHSYLPVLGKVVVKIKKARKVAVRLPEWLEFSAVNTTVGGKKAETRLQGRYLAVEGVTAGDEVELTFPVPDRTLHRVLGRRPYKLTLRGSNVVAIDPPGIVCPLYQRQPTGKLVEKACFIPSKKVIW